MEKPKIERLKERINVLHRIAPEFGHISMYADGKLLKELRTRAGLSQIQMAEKLGVSQSLISQTEQKHDVPGSLIERYLNVIDLKVWQFTCMQSALSLCNSDGIDDLFSDDFEERFLKAANGESATARNRLLKMIEKKADELNSAELFELYKFEKMLSLSGLYKNKNLNLIEFGKEFASS